MNFSNTYIFYPDNAELIKAIEHYRVLRGHGSMDDAPDTSVTVPDNFIHTRGNFEQHLFNNSILEPARDEFESILGDTSKDLLTKDRALLLNSLGNIYAALGQQRMEADIYDKSIAAFESALEVLTQQDSPTEWATTQFNLGTVTQASGRLQSDAKLLKTSVDAYTDALLVWTREESPEDWAASMFQLGVSFYEHGKLLKGNRTFQKSVVAFKNALHGYDADNHALALAATHNCKGAVLHNLAESEENAERMEEAIRSYETALTVCMEQQKPIHLAVLCRVNRSTARAVLAELRKDTLLAEEAADDFELILECFPHALQPLCRKHCEQQMEKARQMSGSSVA